MQKKYFQTDESQNKRENIAVSAKKFTITGSKWGILFLTLLFLLPPKELHAQVTYTLGDGDISSNTLGVSPFATINRNERSQYLYYGLELTDAGAISGNIISLALNITQLGGANLYPENLSIKMKMTSATALGDQLQEGLPVYYSTDVEMITTLGWHTFTLSTPFEWDGNSNILIEICRSNENFGNSFRVESTLNLPLDYRTVGLYSNEATTAGCNLTGVSPMTNTDRRTRPNAQFVMTNPCSGLPAPGETVVSAGPYCNGASFQLSIVNGETSSGLAYQWESSPNDNGPWTAIDGAFNTTYQTSQATATYYRRTTTCIETLLTRDSQGVLVNGEGCYCTAQVDEENAIGINNVTINTINNTSASDIQYSNFTNIQTEINRNASYNLSARVTTLGGTNYTKAWIDWNQNGVYNDNEGYDLGIATDANSSVSQNIIIPVDAALGTTNMRIRTSQSPANVYPDACGAISNGEGEDYTLVILTSLGVNQFNGNANNVLVYKNQTGIVVEMQNENIAGIKVYDLSGRLLFNKKQINQKSMMIESLKNSHQVLIFQVMTQSGTVVYKKQII